VHSKLDEAKAFAWSLLKVNKLGPEQLQSLWEETGAFKAVWKGLTLPELGRVIRLAVKHSRARFRSFSSFNQESDSVSVNLQLVGLA
jgi:DNA polymerase/3'-5' exonuclease PolX